MAAVAVEQSRRESIDSWATYNFEWLFDPDRFDHLPLEEQLKLYKHRNLQQVKFFKTACEIFGVPRSRKRIIVAPPMNKPAAYVLPEHSLPEQQSVTAELKPQMPPAAKPTKQQLQEWKSWDREAKYKSWIAERKHFRKDLENMGLNEEWLSKKPDKTALEHRVLQRMLEERNPRSPSPQPPPEHSLKAVLPDEYPTVHRPSPLAIRVIEKFLQQKKMRLLDLFASVDKKKNWKITRQEFRKAIQEAQIPISDVLLEDLVLALDTDLNDQLDYRELAKGMGLWKREKIDSKRKLVNSGSLNHSASKYSVMCGFESPSVPAQEVNGVSPSKSSVAPASLITHESKQSRIRSALSTISSGSSHLEVPEPDLRPERCVLSSDEAMVDLRKRDKEALSRLTGKKTSAGKHPRTRKIKSGMIKTGDAAIDNHMMPSTLGGSVAAMMDEFRQQSLRQYTAAIQMCMDKGVTLTETLLKKVLLYPADRSHNQIRRHIRQPALHLLSEKFADVPKRARSPDHTSRQQQTRTLKGQGHTSQRSHKGQGAAVINSGGRSILLDPIAKGGQSGSSAYPRRSTLPNNTEKMHLSTGKAIIRSQVDCWITFEEYERLTRQLSNQYVGNQGQSDPNAFWPGQLLDKMRLYLDEEQPNNAVFATIHKQKPSNSGYNNNLNTWPVSDAGYVQYGTIEK